MSQASRTALGVFLKYPEPGRVKTRLAADIGAEVAARIYLRLLEEVLELCRKVEEHGGFSVCLYCDPFRPLADYRNRFPGFSLRKQRGDDLGERLALAFEELLAGARSAVIIGTDCIDITHTLLQSARRELESRDLVLGPTLDGGYYLIGLSRPEPSLFTKVPWSTSTVYEATTARADRAGLRWSRLPILRDVDTLADLRAIRPDWRLNHPPR